MQSNIGRVIGKKGVCQRVKVHRLLQDIVVRPRSRLFRSVILSVFWVDFASADEGDERKDRDGSDEIAKDLVDGDGGSDGDAGGAGGDG